MTGSPCCAERAVLHEAVLAIGSSSCSRYSTAVKAATSPELAVVRSLSPVEPLHFAPTFERPPRLARVCRLFRRKPARACDETGRGVSQGLYCLPR